jgi:hypothetical protein
VGLACRSVSSKGFAAKVVVTLATVVLVFVSRKPAVFVLREPAVFVSREPAVFVSREPAVFVSREPAVPLGFVSPGSVTWVTRPTGLPRMPLRLGRILRG